MSYFPDSISAPIFFSKNIQQLKLYFIFKPSFDVEGAKMRTYDFEPWIQKETAAVVLFSFSIFLLLCSVFSIHCGAFGDWCSKILSKCWGDAEFFIPISLIAFSFSIFCEDTRCLFRGTCFLTLVLCLDAFASIFWPIKFGLIGITISQFLERIGGAVGSCIFLIALGTLSVQYLFRFSWRNILLEIKSNNDYGVLREIRRPVVTYDPCMDRTWKTLPSVLPATQEPAISQNQPTHPIETCLLNFGIPNVRVVDQLKGPVVTRFFLSLPIGIRSNAIANLDKDIARSLSVPSCRVVESILGRSEIALELPNEIRETVNFNSIFSSKAYQESTYRVGGVN